MAGLFRYQFVIKMSGQTRPQYATLERSSAECRDRQGKQMATPQTNEQRLDAAEKILLAVLKDVRNNLGKYNHSDYLALNEAWVKLNAITLTDKINA